MKRNKKLQKYADESLAKYGNEEFLQKMKFAVSQNKQKKRNKKFLYPVLGGIGATVAVVALVCVLLFVPIGETGSSDGGWGFQAASQGASVSKKTTVEELNDSTAGIKFSAENVDSINKAKDKRNKETLYFTLEYSFNDGSDTVKLLIDVSPNFKYVSGKSFDKLEVVNGYKVNYIETVADDGFTASAHIVTPSEEVFIEYSGGGNEGQSDFLSVLESILQ